MYYVEVCLLNLYYRFKFYFLLIRTVVFYFYTFNFKRKKVFKLFEDVENQAKIFKLVITNINFCNFANHGQKLIYFSFETHKIKLLENNFQVKFKNYGL